MIENMKQRLRNIDNVMGWSNVCLIGVEAIFKEIISETFLK